jgi:UDP:flavonoid glycosyltransferase YjiC (YdhE family)
MKKIICMPDGNFLAHVTRPLEIAKCLRNMGYLVEFAGEGDYMRLPAKEGFNVLPLITIDQQTTLDRIRSSRLDLYDYDLVKAHVAAESSFFKVHQPDLVLGDCRMTLRTSCSLNHIPLVMIKNALWSSYYTVQMRAPETHFLTNLFGRKLMNPLVPIIKDFVISFDIRPFKKYHKEQGLPIPKNIYNVIEGDINLLADFPDYGPTANLPPNHIYIGPIVWEPDIPLPDRLRDLDPAKPTIYFTMGSTGFTKFFERAIDIFGNTDFQCIITTADMVSLSNAPDNFYIFDYLPGSKVMEISDVVVCHGGNGTLYQALIQGTPVIGIPTFADQEHNLDRIVSLGAGIHLSEMAFKSSDLLGAVNTVLNDETYKNNAAIYQRKLRDYDGPQKGSQVINNFLCR